MNGPLRYHRREWALEVLTACEIGIGDDFHTLHSGQVENLLDFADEDKYSKPANANGSRARYYFERIQRRAK